MAAKERSEHANHHLSTGGSLNFPETCNDPEPQTQRELRSTTSKSEPNTVVVLSRILISELALAQHHGSTAEGWPSPARPVDKYPQGQVNLHPVFAGECQKNAGKGTS